MGNVMINAAPAVAPELLHHRSKTVAKSFYRQLRAEGFSHEQVIELSAALLDLVNDEMKDRRGPRPT